MFAGMYGRAQRNASGAAQKTFFAVPVDIDCSRAHDAGTSEANREEEQVMGYTLVLEVVGNEVTARKIPPEPVLSPMPKRAVAKVRRPVVIDATCEVVS